MNHPLPRIAAAFLWASLTMILAGCGGGGSSGGSAADTNRTSASVTSTTVTVAEYKALRVDGATTSGGEAPDAATLSKLAADNRHLAVTQLSASLFDPLGHRVNGIAAPPLAYATLRSVAAAASGASLSEIARSFDPAPTPFVAAQQTSRVSSQWWADRGYRFRTGFLSAIDSTGPQPRLAAWSASETGFSDATAASDAAFTRALADAKLSQNDLRATRMLGLHSLHTDIAWSGATPFDGVFAGGIVAPVRLPMLRFKTGVRRYQGADFTADALTVNDLRVIALRPSASTLDAFAASRLEPALAEISNTLIANDASAAAGELVLPQVDLNLAMSATTLPTDAGTRQVFDEVFANLQGLDNVGGTYAVATTAPAGLRLAADRLSLQAAQALAFVFSPRNQNELLHQADANQGFQPCSVVQPDLKAFFLIIVDSRGWIVAIAGIDSLPGLGVSCS